MAKTHDKDSNTALIERFNQAKSKIDAVREIRRHLMELSGSSTDPKGGEVYNLFKLTKHAKGDETSDRQFVSSTLSQIRKTERLKQRTESPSVSMSDEPTMIEIRTVMQAAQELDPDDGLQQLQEHVDIVLPLLKQLGGNPNKLQKTLKFLAEIANR